MANEIVNKGKKWGVYTSVMWWSYIVGDDFSKLSHWYLWYAHWDDNPQFNDP